jgi:hypothetical protein
MRFIDHLGRPIYTEPKKRRPFWSSIPPTLGAAIIVLSGIALMGAATQIDLTAQVKGILATGNGGTGTASTLTGIVRGGSAYTAAELSGDCATAGSNAVTCTKVNGTTVPTNSAADQLVVTTASATGAWKTLADTSAGNLAETYNTTTHAFGTISVLSGTFADAEVPTGTINGSNVTFTLAHTPSPAASLNCFENGISQRAGGADLTLATATITYAVAPPTGATLVCYYRY